MDRFTKKIFSSNLKIVREILGHTQGEFAETIGMTPTTVCGWEKGSSYPSEKILEKIISTHNISKEFLLCGQGDAFRSIT